MWENYFKGKCNARSLCGKLKSQIVNIYQEEIDNSDHEVNFAKDLITAVLITYTSFVMTPVIGRLSIIPVIYSLKYLYSGASSIFKWRKMNNICEEITSLKYDQLAEYIEDVRKEMVRKKIKI